MSESAFSDNLLGGSPLIFLIAFIVFAICYFLFCFFDSLKYARLQGPEYQLKKYNRWYIYLAYWLLTAVVIQPTVEAGIKNYIIQAYKIPSGAMIPTILVGDHILVNKFIYLKNRPQRGDIVVFASPKEHKIDYVKRIVATGGDVVEIVDKKLFINGVGQDDDFATHLSPSIIPPSSGPRDNFGQVTIAPNNYFVMGDNRDNSYDSRFWGTVDGAKIKRKVMYLYWSWDREKTQVRWDRLGKPIE